MLDRSIKMNYKICGKYMSKFFGCLFFVFLLMLDVFTILGLLAAFVCVMLAYRELFDRSLFGEEAYTYMMVPLSMKDVILGKAIAANLCMMEGFAIMWVTFGVAGLFTGMWDWDMGFGSIGGHLLQFASGLYDAVGDGVVSAGEIIYDRGQLMGLAVNLVLLPVQFLSFSIFVCAVYQLGAIMRHLIDPQRSSGIATIGVVFGSMVVLLGVTAGIAVVDDMISGDIATIFTAVIWIIVPAACGVCMLIGSIKVLEKKYNLC